MHVFHRFALKLLFCGVRLLLMMSLLLSLEHFLLRSLVALLIGARFKFTKRLGTRFRLRWVGTRVPRLKLSEFATKKVTRFIELTPEKRTIRSSLKIIK